MGLMTDDAAIAELGPASLFNEIRRWLIVYGLWRDPDPVRSQVTALQHCLQAATRAERDGADTNDIVMALLHDAARPLAGGRGGEVMATMLRGKLPPSQCNAMRYAPEFLSDILTDTHLADRHSGESWWNTGLHLARWCALSHDPGYAARPLSHFAERLLSVCER